MSSGFTSNRTILPLPHTLCQRSGSSKKVSCVWHLFVNWTKLIPQLGFNDNHSIKYHNKLCPPIAFHLSTSNFDIHSNRNISYFYGRSIKKFFTALTTNIHKTFGQRPAFLVVRSVQKPQRQCKYLIRKIKTSSVSVRSIGFRSSKLLLSKDVSFFVSLSVFFWKQ